MRYAIERFAQRFLLQRDADALIKQAEASAVLRSDAIAHSDLERR